MKKILILLMAAALLLSLAACGADTEAQEPAADELTGGSAADAGGWNIAPDDGAPVIPEEAQAALDAALEGYTGQGFTPLAYLGSQVVAGVNYAFVCKGTTVTEQPETALKTVVVTKDLEGNASILRISDVELTDYLDADADADSEGFPEMTVGGWTLTTEASALNADVQAAFDKAVADQTDVQYIPLACLGSQVVAGANYAVLCTAVDGAEEGAAGLVIVKIYADLEGGAQVLSVADFTIA